MVMTTPMIIMSFAIAILIAGFAGYLFWAQRKFAELEAENLLHKESLQLKMAAYERITLLAERSKLDNLVSRLYQPGMTATDMQLSMISSLKEEYAHNVTQQLYVSSEVWDALTRMKDQNIYIVNQVAMSLPQDASALDFNKQLLTLLSMNSDTTLNNVVLSAIRFEMGKLLG
jgi:hypothetical protein